MTIKEELRTELIDAMKTGDARRRDVIRMIETEVTLARSAPGFQGEVDADLYRRVIASYAKKMDKAKAEFEEAGERGGAMAEKLGWEVAYLSRWLPQMLDEESTAALVRSTIEEMGVAGDPKASGRVIGQIMRTHKDELDGALVNRLVAETLNAN